MGLPLRDATQPSMRHGLANAFRPSTLKRFSKCHLWKRCQHGLQQASWWRCANGNPEWEPWGVMG
eukprot:5379467-Amphidinium_carterae.2